MDLIAKFLYIRSNSSMVPRERTKGSIQLSSSKEVTLSSGRPIPVGAIHPTSDSIPNSNWFGRTYAEEIGA
jgi:hypothetical protein